MTSHEGETSSDLVTTLNGGVSLRHELLFMKEVEV